MSNSERVVLIDGSAIVFRAWFALPGSLQNSAGLKTNANYGFANMFRKRFAGMTPSRGAVVFDAPGCTLGETVRHEINHKVLPGTGWHGDETIQKEVVFDGEPPDLRAQRVHGFIEVAPAQYRRVLQDALSSAPDDGVPLVLMWPVEATPLAADREVLLDSLDNRYDKVQRQTACALGKLGYRAVVSILREKTATTQDYKVAEVTAIIATQLGG
jgi:hypothetical protein